MSTRGTDRWLKALALFQQTKLGYTFKNPRLLEEALTHASFAHESGLLFYNERLEFLGDAVLELVISGKLFSELPQEPEGRLTRERASIVCTTNLGQWGKTLDVDKLIRLGKGLNNQGGRENNSIVADAVEAVFGAVFVDGGFLNARDVILKVINIQRSSGELPSGNVLDPKTRLQHYLQTERGQLPSYQIVAEEGPSHAPTFVVEVWSEGELLGVGTGSSRKRAESDAARIALAKTM